MIHAWGITDTGSVRQQNQDGFYLDLPSGTLAVGVVCDGMGGARAGNIASLLAVETFVDALQNQTGEVPDAPSRPAAVRGGAGQPGGVSPGPDRPGPAGAWAPPWWRSSWPRPTAYLLNIGDSRAYHISEDGIVKVTRDHSVVEDLMVRGQITPEQARTHPRKNLITRALGAESHIRADLV